MSYFSNDASCILVELFVKPAFIPGMAVDPNAVAKAKKDLDKVLDVIDKILGNQKFMAGRHLHTCGHLLYTDVIFAKLD